MTNVRLLSSCLLTAACCLAVQAHAQDIEKPFIGLDYSLRTYENEKPNVSKTEVPAVRLRAGSVVLPYLAVEAHVALGTGDDTGKIGGTTPYTIESPLSYGIFVRPQLKLGALSLYGLAGYSYVELEYSAALAAGNPTDSIKDFSFGGGVQIDIGQHWGLNADYIQYVEGFTAVSGGLVYRF